MKFTNLCGDCVDVTDTTGLFYCGLTLSLPPECDRCHKARGKFMYTDS